jgi:hypothetical protein
MFKFEIMHVLKKYGEEGVKALRDATPKDSGETADSWGYEITKDGRGYVITWTNSKKNKGVPIAIILQYGHGTGTGGYVEGRDYINPATRPIFDAIAEEAWKEVTKV